ncbi:histidine phosphatase family protein [Luedemannella helvata]|uniref:Histidine phosphatase family protein n=1 Tax=Luedemannella helvata TaxID=349315 RepID=A0ABP4WJ47_9ACTN
MRHAMPLIDPDTDLATWPLSADGVAAARALGPLLPAGAVLVSSDEPKAHATLSLATGRDVVIDARLREVARPRELFSDDFAQARRAYVAGSPPPGWERPAAVARRIADVISAHRVPGRPLVLAGHGMAFTTWLAAGLLVADPARFWSDLRLPDAFEVMARGVRRLDAA